MDDVIDILIFGGQSNMQGQTEGMPEDNAPVEGAWEYRLLSDTLIPLRHPVGELVGDELIKPATEEGGGSLVPDCCRVYSRLTGHGVVAIHAARGATTVAQWLKGTDRYGCALEKILGGIRKAKSLGRVGRIWYLWLQGESDAIERTSEEEYIRMLTQYKNDLKTDVGIDRFGIIGVGYFCGAPGHETHFPDGRARDEVIMAAQDRIVEEDPDFVMLTRICRTLSLDPACTNPFAKGHYNNASMTRIGTEAARALAVLRD